MSIHDRYTDQQTAIFDAHGWKPNEVLLEFSSFPFLEGDLVTFEGDPKRYRVKSTETKGFATVAELVAHVTPTEAAAFFRGPAHKAWVNPTPWKRGRKAGGIKCG